MLKISDAAHFRRVVAGLCLVAAPLLFAVAEIATPQPSGSAAAQLASFAQHRDQLLVGVLCGLASSMCFAPALFGLLHKIRDRGVAYAHVAAVLIVYGLVTQAAVFGINVMFWVMTKPGMNHAAMVNLLNGLQHGPAVAGCTAAGRAIPVRPRRGPARRRGVAGPSGPALGRNPGGPVAGSRYRTQLGRRHGHPGQRRDRHRRVRRPRLAPAHRTGCLVGYATRDRRRAGTPAASLGNLTRTRRLPFRTG